MILAITIATNQGDVMTRDDNNQRLTHVDEGGAAHMVDVTAKPATVREAKASGIVSMRRETLQLVRENTIVKGDVFGVARIAGILGAKRTSELIPLCHGVPLSGVDVSFEFDDVRPSVIISATARVEGKTGVEMEALTAVSVAALTIYDMCKSVDRDMVIEGIKLTYKAGGSSGTYRRHEEPSPSKLGCKVAEIESL